MAEHFLTDRKYLPIAARYEFLRGFPILKAYRNFCQAVGNDAMNYKDFDFWWFRFSKGNFDLDTQPPQTADLNSFPDHIIGKIIGKTGYAARCLFRKTSKKYRKAVDSIPFVIDRLKFEHREQSSSLEFNGFEIQFYRRIGVYGKYKYPNRIMCRSKNYSKLAVNELVFIFGLKNVRVKKFTMYVNGRYVNENLDILKSLDFKFRVETFKFNFGWIRFGEEDLINVQDEVMKILPYLEPRVLQNVEFHINYRELKLETNRIVKTLQWKYLKRVNIYGNVVISTKSLTRFKKLSVLNYNFLLLSNF
uniref:F-box domain-containing protein n=1 Tax=Caenorhabditis tropicalis TaxID=1561998 RepID=A0A1I7UPB2_9PELO